MVSLLITDADSRKSFDIYNIVKKKYKHINIILTAEKDINFQLPIIYNQKIHKLSTQNLEIYTNNLDEIIGKEKESDTLIYFPVSDKNIDLFYQYTIQKNANLNPKLKYLLPSYQSYKTTLNKIEFQTFCETNHLPIPQRLFKDDIKKLSENFYSVISKPFIGAGSIGLQFVNDKNELYKLQNIDFDKNIIQKKISNGKDIEGAFFLVNNGEVICCYSHQRIRVFPESGGVTVYSASTQNQQVFEIGKKVLNKLNWSGLAMIEFMYDTDDGEYKIIELNPRSWGSYLLSEKAGLNFTINYINICIEKSLQATHYQQAFIRWFIPFDLFLYFKSKFTIKNFWKFNTSNTAYINFTYGSLYSVFLFQLYFIFNASSIKKLGKKIIGKRK